MMPHAVLYVQGKEDRWRNLETSLPDVALHLLAYDPEQVTLCY